VRRRLEFVSRAVLREVFTRAIRGGELSRSLDQALTLTALERALEGGPGPQIHHSDHGGQDAATAYVVCREQCGVRISRAAVGEPRPNGYAARRMRPLTEEEVDLSEYLDCADASAHLDRFRDDVYQRKRIHAALGYLTPAEFEAEWVARQHEQHSIAIPSRRGVECLRPGAQFTLYTHACLLGQEMSPDGPLAAMGRFIPMS
jgi:transposase InsO family protein